MSELARPRAVSPTGSCSIIPRERLSGLQRLEFGAFQPTRAQVASGTTSSTADDPERMRREVREEAHRAGYAEGRKEARVEAQRIQAILGALDREVLQLEKKVAHELLDLALAIARQVLGQALKVRPELVLPLVQEAIQTLSASNQPASVAVHPEDASLVRQHLGEQLTACGWKIVEDARLQRGGCRLETAHGELDATLAGRWERVVATLGESGEWLE